MKKREKWGNISASLDSQNAREKDTKPFPASDSWDNAWKSREKNWKAKRRNHNVQGIPHTVHTSSRPRRFHKVHTAAAWLKDKIMLLTDIFGHYLLLNLGFRVPWSRKRILTTKMCVFPETCFKRKLWTISSLLVLSRVSLRLLELADFCCSDKRIKKWGDQKISLKIEKNVSSYLYGPLLTGLWPVLLYKAVKKYS